MERGGAKELHLEHEVGAGGGLIDTGSQTSQCSTLWDRTTLGTE